MTGKQILISDDSASIRALISSSLKKAGYNVIITSDGQEAIDKLDGRSIDLVITDLNMPKADGLEVVKGVRSSDIYKFTPVLILTTETQLAQKEKAKKTGATGWIEKPFDEKKLLYVINKVLRFTN